MSDIKCHFCGYRCSESELLVKCQHCPLKLHHAGIGVSCCPNCGIELKLRSSVVDLASRLAARLGKMRR